MEGALSEIMAGSPQALFVVSSLLFELIIPWQTVNLVLKSGLPALYVRREFPEIGGLMSYGIPYREMCRTAADYIVKILPGEKAADLPVQLPVKIELVVNLKNSESARHHCSRIAARPRRRSDRIAMLFAAVHMSLPGPKRHFAASKNNVAIGVTTDIDRLGY